MGFNVALADVNTGTTRIVGSERPLSPAPTRVSYPSEPLGARLETPDGRLIVQQPAKDNRVRTWYWDNYPGFLTQYEMQYQYLVGLRSRYRQDGSRQSPFIFVQDTSTKRLRRRVVEIRLLSTGGSSTSVLIDDLATMTVNKYAGATLEVLDSGAGGSGTGAYQRASIVSNTSNQLVLFGTLTTVPTAAKVAITYWVDDWFRARVIDVGRDLRDDGGNVRYKETRFSFVIDDAAYNDLG